MYDFLLVGAGLFNAVFCYEALHHGCSCLVLEKRAHIGGNCYTYEDSDIIVHKYGAHIFRTSDRQVWAFMQSFAEFNNFINSPIARYHEETYNLPFNMNTFAQMWHIFTPAEAKARIEEQSKGVHLPPRNLEEQAMHLVGRDIYEKLIKGYTEKQWGRACCELPVSIIRRLPLRFTYDNNYYSDRYQGIPIGGFTPLIEQMMRGADICLQEDFLDNRDKWEGEAKHIVYTGTIDRYYDYRYGALSYRSLRFETEKLDADNFQGVAVVNYTDSETPYTRIIEHKHFEFGSQPHTIITREYPAAWQPGDEPYYPINDERNNLLYRKYAELASHNSKIRFAGRLGAYRYTDMQDTVKAAWQLWQEWGAEVCRK